MPAENAPAPLQLLVARGFSGRLGGLLAHGPLGPHQGLCLDPCRAIHTFAMGYCIDVVFLDGQARVLRVVHSLPAWRLAWHGRAAMVVELPGGYCRRHADHAARIQSALASLAPNTLR